MEPKSLQQAILYFSNPENCRKYLVARRWPDGVACPRCGKQNVLFLEKYNRWHCREKHDAPQFTLKTGTIFEDSPISLDKWLTAMWMIVNAKNGVSSWEIHRALKVTQKTAWFMLHRIRLAMKAELGHGSVEKLGGKGSEVEVDETFIGGKARNMHKDKRIRMMHDRGNTTFIGRHRPGNLPGKVAVHGVLDRESRQIRATIVPNIKRETLQKAVLDNVHASSTVYTDQATAYDNLRKHSYTHEVVNHLQEYVRGRVHTNGMENFWSLLKRGLNGTYVAVEPFHLFRYVDEQVWRYNNRGTKDNPLDDADRFDAAIRQIVGKRVTFAELTGKSEERPAETEPF